MPDRGVVPVSGTAFGPPRGGPPLACEALQGPGGIRARVPVPRETAAPPWGSQWKADGGGQSQLEEGVTTLWPGHAGHLV